jgi:hypothetical protein
VELRFGILGLIEVGGGRRAAWPRACRESLARLGGETTVSRS